jgi:hypothetical protein
VQGPTPAHGGIDAAAFTDLTREELIELLRSQGEGGIRLQFSGKDNARRTTREVRPRVIPPKSNARRLRVRFASAGHWSKDVEQLTQTGFTVWSLNQDHSLRATHMEDSEESVARALKPL